MIKVCYCKTCDREFLKSTCVDMQCVACEDDMVLCKILYSEFTKFSEKERQRYLQQYKRAM